MTDLQDERYMFTLYNLYPYTSTSLFQSVYWSHKKSCAVNPVIYAEVCRSYLMNSKLQFKSGHTQSLSDARTAEPDCSILINYKFHVIKKIVKRVNWSFQKHLGSFYEMLLFGRTSTLFYLFDN